MRRRTKILIVLPILIVIIAAVFLILKARTAPEQAAGEMNVIAVQRGDIQVKVLATGTIQPFTRVEVRSPQKGRIEEVKADEGNWVRKGSVLALISGEDRISLLDAASSMMQQAVASGDEDAIARAKLASETATNAYLPISITSPLRARVIRRLCQPGQNIGVSDVLFVLSDRLVAGVEVDETDIGKVYVGQKAVITLDAFPEETRTGKTVKISQEGRTVSNVVIYDVQVDPETIPSNWSSGMTANVEFVIHDLNGVLLLPVSAIHQKGMTKMVMLAGEKPHPREIETGATDGKVVEIKSGLSEGDSVVVMGESGPMASGTDRSGALRALSRWRRASRGSRR